SSDVCSSDLGWPLLAGLLAGGASRVAGSCGPGAGPRWGQKSMQRPFFSQSPYRVGSGPSRPPYSTGFRSPASSAGTASAASRGDPSETGPERCSPQMSPTFTHASLSLRSMSDKTSGSGSTCFALPGWSAVTLRGEQATAFAQAQFMGDLSDLAPGRWQWNGWLTPKGRLVALFALLALDGRDLALLLP